MAPLLLEIIQEHKPVSINNKSQMRMRRHALILNHKTTPILLKP